MASSVSKPTMPFVRTTPAFQVCTGYGWHMQCSIVGPYYTVAPVSGCMFFDTLI